MKNISTLKKLLERPCKSVITTHFRPDADALGSSLGLARHLKKKGHSVQVITPSGYPRFLAWMPGNEEVLALRHGQDKEDKERVAEKLIAEADLIFCLDFSHLDRVNELGDHIRVSTAKKVLIDHHLDPDQFADFTHWDPKAASTAGLVFDFISLLGDRKRIDADIANCLYAGLMTDTGGFRHANTTQKEFLTAAELVASGGDPSYVSRMIYDSNTLTRIRFTGFVLYEKLHVLPEYSTAYIPLHIEDLSRFNVQTGDTEGLVNYGLSIAGIQLAVLLYDWRGEVKLSFRSLGSFPANEVAKKHFNGGGHLNAAGGSSVDTLEGAVKKLLSILPQYKDQLNPSS